MTARKMRPAELDAKVGRLMSEQWEERRLYRAALADGMPEAEARKVALDGRVAAARTARRVSA